MKENAHQWSPAARMDEQEHGSGGEWCERQLCNGTKGTKKPPHRSTRRPLVGCHVAGWHLNLVGRRAHVSERRAPGPGHRTECFIAVVWRGGVWLPVVGCWEWACRGRFQFWFGVLNVHHCGRGEPAILQVVVLSLHSFEIAVFT